MRSIRSWFFGGLILTGLILLLIFRFAVTVLLVNLRVLPAYFSDTSFNYQSFQKLKLDNQSLTTQLTLLTNSNAVSPDRYHYVAARVYSRYPFNDRSSIVIDAGTAEGLKVGAPVLAEKGVIFGKIINVSRTQSEVQTIFDPTWRESVRVGGANALLVGGTNPELQLIPKDTVLAATDRITNLSPDLPMGFLIGDVGPAQKDQTGTWLTAALNPPYDLGSLDQVLVVTDFP